ncbi:MAG: glycoside hydrolase family 16 protein [Gemmatimonadota bacterium]
MNSVRPPRRHLLGLALVSILVVGSGGRCGEDPMTWRVVWQDEFEGAAGQSPDPSRWQFDVGEDWGNAQLEYDTSRPQNVSLDGNGNLAITARKEEYLGREYTSGRINTRGLFEQQGGRFEARIRLPVGRGIWPAFWLLGSDFEEVGWPTCGEIDIMEYRGQEPDIVHGSVHGPGYSGGSAVTGRYDSAGVGLDGDFHIFAVEWDYDRITWILDSTRYLSITRDSLPSGTRWVFDHPFFIILNVAVGGNFVGPPDSETSFPQTMLVDWVRVYRLEP